MGEIEEEKFDQLCRLCASYDAVQMDIFGDKGRERKIIEKIHTCLPFQVEERDVLPKSICYRCMYNLENFYDFRKGCVDAVNRLEKFIASTGRIKIKQECNNVPMDEDEENDDDDDIPNPADFLETACLVDETPTGSQPECKETVQLQPNTEYTCPVDDFRCTTCGRTFNSRGALTLHSKYHTGESDQSQLYTCHVCDKVFSSKGHLASHSKVHIGDLTERQPSDPSAPIQPRPFKCDLCEKAYSMAKHLWGHVSVSHKGDPLVTCQFCNRTFSTIANLEDHKKSKHATEISALIAETLQGDNVVLKTEMEDGADNNDDGDDFEEDADDEADGDIDKEGDNDVSKQATDSAAAKSNTSNNRRKSSKPKKLRREESREENASGDDKSNNEEGKMFPCVLCQSVFEVRGSLHDHLVQVHGMDSTELFSQQQSRSGFENDEEYNMSENMMETENVFCCEVCARDFNDRASLWLHMLYSHREEAATTCGICLRVCSDYATLTDHVQNCHPKDSLKSDQKRYSCQICGRQLDSKKKLLTHVKIHNLYDNSGQVVDPESVIVLNSKFNQQNLQTILKESSEYENSIFENLKEEGHVMSCEICFKVFPNEEKLVKHKQNAHRNSQGPNSVNSSTTYYLYFSCEICGLSHSTRTERWRHVFSSHADEPSLLCEEKKCGKVFPTRALKNEHAATHHSLQGEVPNTCEVCGKLWATRINFWKHMMSVHSDCLPFICGVCLKIFCTVADLSNHVRESHVPLKEGDFCCDICGRPYSNKSKMSRHRKIHALPEAEGGLPPGHELEVSTPLSVSDRQSSIDPSDQLKCSLCPEEEFIALEQLSQHRRSVHNQVPCDLCTKFYGRSSHLWKHVNKIHKNHPDITCNLCYRTSASRSHLANHMAKHHRDESQNYVDISELSNEEPVHACEKCKKIFRKHVLMRKHMKHCVGPKESGPVPSPCDRCSKVFDSPVLLRKHKRSSHLLFRCQVCEDVAHDSRYELMEHIKADHPGHPDLACTFDGCNKMLRCKSDLDKHKREHRLGRMPPTCGFCGELTPNKIKLRNHLKTQHPTLTKYLCAVCLVTYKDFDDLKKHVNLLHKTVLAKPNVCPVCARTYSNKSKVLAHIRSHGDNFFPCNKCLKICSKEEQLKRHLEAHMEENSDDEVDDNDDDEDESQTIDTETNNDDVESTDKTLPTADEDETDSKDEMKKLEDDCIVEEIVPDDVIDNDIDEIPSKRPRRSYTHACSACSKTFPSAGDLLDHTKSEHNELLCACGKISDNIDSHTAHAKKCVSANKAENNKKLGLMNNKTDVTSKNILDTDRKRKTAVNNKDNQTVYNSDEVRSCTNDSSSKGIGRPREVRRVYTVDEGLCFCELCNKSFDAKRHLWQHLRRFHIKEAATSCGVCLKVCKDYPSLDNHLALDHKNNFEGEGKNFTCRVCGRYHNSRSKLEQHSVIHPGQQARTQAALFNCAYCSLAFNSETVLLKHELSEHQQPNDPGEVKESLVQDEDSRSSTSSSSSNNSSSSSSSENSTSSNNSSSSSSSGSSSSNSSSSSNNSSSSSCSSDEEDDNSKVTKKQVKSKNESQNIDDGSSCEVVDDKLEKTSSPPKKSNKSKINQLKASKEIESTTSVFSSLRTTNKRCNSLINRTTDSVAVKGNESYKRNKFQNNVDTCDNNSIVTIDDDDDDEDDDDVDENGKDRKKNAATRLLVRKGTFSNTQQNKFNQSRNKVQQSQQNKTNRFSGNSSLNNICYDKTDLNCVSGDSSSNSKDDALGNMNAKCASSLTASGTRHSFNMKDDDTCNLSEESSVSSDEENNADDCEVMYAAIN